MAAITYPALTKFAASCVAMQPGTENSGTAGAFKPGYHNSREELLKNPAWRNDYSIRLPDDKLGPSNAGAAFDWTFHDAQNGNYGTIMRYMGRIEAAFNARDPRLHGWREVLGQADLDAQAEGFDFVGWYRRTPDSTHTWHIHFSKLRRYADDWPTYSAMLSILVGETAQSWIQRGGSSMGKQMLIRANDDPQVWLCDGMFRRRIPIAMIPAVGNGQTHQAGFLGNLGNDGAIYVTGPAASLDVWGIDIETLDNGDGSPLTPEALAEALATPAVREVLTESAFDGAQRAERE